MKHAEIFSKDACQQKKYNTNVLNIIEIFLRWRCPIWEESLEKVIEWYGETCIHHFFVA